MAAFLGAERFTVSLEKSPLRVNRIGLSQNLFQQISFDSFMVGGFFSSISILASNFVLYNQLGLATIIFLGCS